MARTEARIKCEIWDDEDFRSLTLEAQWLYQAILTQKDLSLCGVLTWTPKRFAKLAANAKAEATRRALGLLRTKRYVVLDEDTDELWVRTFITNDRVLDNPNSVIGMSQAFGAIHSQPIRKGLVEGLGEGFLDGLPERFDKGLPKGFMDRLAGPFVQALALAGARPPPPAPVPPASILQPPASPVKPTPLPPAERGDSAYGQEPGNPRALGTNPRANGTNPRGPKPLDPLEAQAAAQRDLAEREPCLTCGNRAGWIYDEGDVARPCPACRPAEVAS